MEYKSKQKKLEIKKTFLFHTNFNKFQTFSSLFSSDLKSGIQGAFFPFDSDARHQTRVRRIVRFAFAMNHCQALFQSTKNNTHQTMSSFSDFLLSLFSSSCRNNIIKDVFFFFPFSKFLFFLFSGFFSFCRNNIVTTKMSSSSFYCLVFVLLLSICWFSFFALSSLSSFSLFFSHRLCPCWDTRRIP